MGLHGMLAAVPELSHLLFLHAQAPFFAAWRRNHNKTRGSAPFVQNMCNIRSTWIFVKFQLCFAETQFDDAVLKTLYHIFVLALSPCHNSKDPCIESAATIIEIFLLGSQGVSVANAQSKSITEMCSVSTDCFVRLPFWALGLDADLASGKKTQCRFVGLTFFWLVRF